MQGALHRIGPRGDLVCRIQADLGIATPHVLCAPVVPKADWGVLVPRLHIPVMVGDVPHVIVMSRMLTVPMRDLGPALNLAVTIRNEIRSAANLLVHGFTDP